MISEKEELKETLANAAEIFPNYSTEEYMQLLYETGCFINYEKNLMHKDWDKFINTQKINCVFCYAQIDEKTFTGVRLCKSCLNFINEFLFEK